MTRPSGTVWHGRRGAVMLGPVEDRVARYLDRATRWGAVTIRTARIVAELHLWRSEVYRVMRRLRVLGLFGIANDQGGTRGGRLIWRTAIEHDTARPLDGSRHRAAWARVLGKARAAARRARGSVRPARPRSVRRFSPGGPSFSERMRAAGLAPELLRSWGLAP